MDFYRLKKPGSEWFARQGDAIKASRAEKVEWEKIEVPDSKPDRLAWLNANARGGSVEEPGEIDQGRDEERFWEVGPKTKDPPRVAAPRSSAISSRRWSSCRSLAPPPLPPPYNGCPKCQRTFTAQVIMGIGSVKLD
jgi:hypothetical protein